MQADNEDDEDDEDVEANGEQSVSSSSRLAVNTEKCRQLTLQLCTLKVLRPCTVLPSISA